MKYVIIELMLSRTLRYCIDSEGSYVNMALLYIYPINIVYSIPTKGRLLRG